LQFGATSVVSGFGTFEYSLSVWQIGFDLVFAGLLISRRLFRLLNPDLIMMPFINLLDKRAVAKSATF